MNLDFSTQGSYRPVALATYGHSCEWFGCGWDAATCDVHHIDYQEQWAAEREFRSLLDGDWKFSPRWLELQEHAQKMGWGIFDAKTRQLKKNDKASNLTVLCPNHHRYVHNEDLGMKVLKYIPKREQE